jgi:hypothetical protein
VARVQGEQIGGDAEQDGAQLTWVGLGRGGEVAQSGVNVGSHGGLGKFAIKSDYSSFIDTSLTMTID